MGDAAQPAGMRDVRATTASALLQRRREARRARLCAAGVRLVPRVLGGLQRERVVGQGGAGQPPRDEDDGGAGAGAAGLEGERAV